MASGLCSRPARSGRSPCGSIRENIAAKCEAERKAENPIVQRRRGRGQSILRQLDSRVTRACSPGSRELFILSSSQRVPSACSLARRLYDVASGHLR